MWFAWLDFCGVFLGKVGGIVDKLNFKGVVEVLKQSEKLVRSTRKFLQSAGVIIPHMEDLEVNLRDRACEVQAYAQMIEDDNERPLIS
ncbi:hypothetical protein ES707_19626 [subsurface metagenome]